MNKKKSIKRSRPALGAIFMIGFLYVGSYGQDSLGVRTPADTAKNAENAVPADQSIAQASSVAAEKPAVTDSAPAGGNAVSDKGQGEEAQEQEIEFKVSYIPIKKDKERNTVKSDKISKESTANILRSLQGRVAGVNVTRSRGLRQTDMDLRVRGFGTINNNDPLYIVDGVPVRSIDFINPDDVESISILKNPSEIAIYGSRGANGVVVITTKTAK